MSDIVRIAALVFNQPLLVLPETAALIADVVERRIGGGAPADGDAQASRFVGRPDGPRAEDGRTVPMWRLEGSTAIVPVLGELVNRGAWVGASSGLVSYEGLQATLREAAASDRVAAIVLDMNSPGGEARGAMETGRLVREISARKPVVAYVNSTAASAAYAIAAGATKIVATETGVAGSIGVVVMLRDMSAAMEKAGVRTTLLYAGAHKVDGNPFSTLPDDARARIQGKIDEIYSKFTSFVADMRGMSDRAVRATEGGTYMGEGAVKAGLVDSIGTLDTVLAELKAPPSPGLSLNRGASMTTEPTGASAMKFTQENLDAAVAEASASARKAGAGDERARIALILDSDEAKGRDALARHYAFSTDDAPEKALAALKAAPKAEASAGSRLDLHAPDHRAGDDVAEEAKGMPAVAAGWDRAIAAVSRR